MCPSPRRRFRPAASRDDLGVVAAAVNVSNVRFPKVQRARSAVAAPATADAAPAPASPVNIATATVAEKAVPTADSTTARKPEVRGEGETEEGEHDG